MGRQEVRAQLVTWLSQESGLDVVLPTFPKTLDFEQYAQTGSESRAVGIVFIKGEREERIALGGAHSGWKRVDFDVDVQVYHHSMALDAVDAMNDLDQRVDTLKARLRADHNFGDVSGRLVWQGAEPAIDATFGEPLTNDYGAVESWAQITFIVTQMIQA